MSRIRILRVALSFWLCLAVLCLSAWSRSEDKPQDTIRVGVLFSSTGTMAESERPLQEATMLAIEQINQSGIVMASERRFKLEAVVADGASSPAQFAEKAVDLMDHHQVRIFFGCWTSDSRKAVLKVIEPRGGLLYYPLQFEGQEESRAAVYSGLTANQQLFPALEYLLNNGQSRIFLVGSDYLYPRATNRLARQYLKEHKGTVVGERYRPRGASDFASIIREIKNSHCDAVLNTINGDSQRSFFQEYKASSLTAPIMSLSLGESQAALLGQVTDNHLSCWGYFMALQSPQNARFCAAFKMRYGQNRVVDDPCETAYTQVMAFAQALMQCGHAEPAELREATRALILDTPGGLVRYDPRNLYCWRAIRVARFQNGKAQIVWSSELPIRPEPFPGAKR